MNKATRKGTNTNRNADGQFTFGKFERVCKCGRRLAEHDAEKPYPFGDYAMDPRDLPDCDGFKPQRGVYMTDAEFAQVLADYEAARCREGVKKA